MAELARLAVGEEEVVGEEDRLRLAGGLLCGRSVGSGLLDREGGVGDAGGVGGGGWRGLRGRGGVGQALHRTCREKRRPQLSHSGARRGRVAGAGLCRLGPVPQGEMRGPQQAEPALSACPVLAAVVTPQPRGVWGGPHQRGTHPSGDTTPPHQPRQASPRLLPPLSQKKQEKSRILPRPTPWLAPFKQGEPSPSFSTSCFLLIARICSTAANPRLQSTRTRASTRAYSAKRLLNFQQVPGAAGLQRPSWPR